MEIFENPSAVWFIVGLLFFLLEFALPGLIIIFFAAGAFLIATLSLFFNFSIEMQLIIFIIGSLLSLVIFRKGLKKVTRKNNGNQSLLEDEFLGKTGVAETIIGPGQNGKVDFKGTRWDAKSEDFIQKGEQVTIIGNESILLIVQSTRNLK